MSEESPSLQSLRSTLAEVIALVDGQSPLSPPAIGLLYSLLIGWQRETFPPPLPGWLKQSRLILPNGRQFSIETGVDALHNTSDPDGSYVVVLRPINAWGNFCYIYAVGATDWPYPNDPEAWSVRIPTYDGWHVASGNLVATSLQVALDAVCDTVTRAERRRDTYAVR